jgi:hypothetical protein
MKESLEILGGAISGNPLPNGTVVTGGLNPAISNNLTITNIYDGTTDYTPPPTPTGFSISSGFTNILLSWNDPNTSGTFLNYAYTEIWRSVNNVLGNAVLQGFAPGAVYSDPVGTSKTYYYWIRFVSQADVAGPYNSSTGTIGGTGLVGGVDLGPLIIDATKLAADAVESGKIKDAAITTTKIANLAVGNAAIANLAVNNAKIADLAVDDAKIANLSVNKLTAGSVNVGQYIQSTGFSSGTNGWYIGGNGVAEFGAAVIRGQITANQIDSRGLSIKDANGVVIFAAGTALNYAYITPDSGWLNSALTPSITTAQNTANSASSAASTAQGTANSASSAASTAQGTANTALSTANSKLSKAGDTVSGRITFAVADGMFAGSDTNNGVYFGSTGLLGRKNGNTTFYINTAGDAVFGGQLVVGGSPAISGTTMTGNGAVINPTGTFAIGSNTTNVTFNGDTLKLNGNVVGIENLKGGASLPDYLRVYTGSATVIIQDSIWTSVLMDGSPINNTLGVIEAGSSYSYFPAGTYQYELTIPVSSTNSDTNELVCTAIGGFPDGINFGILSNCGASSIGDWQTMPIYGVGRFTLATAGYVGPVIQSLDGFPTVRIFGRSGFCTVVWKVFRA